MAKPTTPTTRRNFVVAMAASIVLVPVAGREAPATPQSLRKKLTNLYGRRTPQEGRVHIDLPMIVEDGRKVLVGLAVDSPMTETDYVKALHFFAEENPTPEVASFYFTPACGKANVAMVFRMAKTQRLIAVAEMNDGRLFIGHKRTKVTIGGCGGAN
jgi:sulfur-oxidizing protein SoxY